VLRAAVVLFGDRHKIEGTYPQCQLRVGKLRETVSGGFGDLRHLYGNAFRLLELAEEFIRDNTPKPGHLIPGVFERADDPFYPPLALREALANALCHRDYSIGGGAVTIRLQADNRLEVISSGGLHFGLTRDALFRPHDSKPWNPLIADVFYRRGLIDSFGTGIERMTEQMARAGLPTPDIDEVGGSVIVALSPPEKSREERVLEFARRQGAITTSDAVTVTGASRATAKRLLTKLVEEGRLEPRGKGPKSHYVLP
jgi:ATP-dependent DNA helicase RecG